MKEIIDIDKKSSFITFILGKESFAVNVDQVLEIIQLEKLTEIPNASEYIRGVLNFRGSIVPVINLHKRFGFKASGACNIAVIVNLSAEGSDRLIGLTVEEVTDVVQFDYKSIRAVPEVGINIDHEYLEGIVEISKEFVFVLNMNKAFDTSELSKLEHPDFIATSTKTEESEEQPG
ncbi:MAG: chemotaxis protein CheW [Cytophagales bacterium]|nr:chemotaxis protein CheW [Cytophagales bacterium]